MADRQCEKTFEPETVRRVSTCVRVAVCLAVVFLFVSRFSVPAVAQQELTIRLLDAEEEIALPSNDVPSSSLSLDDPQTLTPPGESRTRFREIDQGVSPLPRSPLTGPLDPALAGPLDPAEKSTPSEEAPSDEAASEEADSPEVYEQRQFQNNLYGIQKHLLSHSPSDSDASGGGPLSSDDGSPMEFAQDDLNQPECVWRFAPFQRIRLLGHHLFGPRRTKTPFAKLFPWNRTPGRNQGVGEPLVNDSWRWSPLGIGWYMGMMDGSSLVTDWTSAKQGYYGGYTLTWDFDHYWGAEFRYGFATLAQTDSQRAFDAQAAAHIPYDHRFGKRHAELKYGDFNFLYYPWGDARWRPYAKMGIGWGYVKFSDLLYKQWSNSTMTMPMGIGLKYRYSRRLVFRMELMDNFLFGERGINPQHNFSITGGIEIRFGGTRKAYWPYNPGRHYW